MKQLLQIDALYNDTIPKRPFVSINVLSYDTVYGGHSIDDIPLQAIVPISYKQRDIRNIVNLTNTTIITGVIGYNITNPFQVNVDVPRHLMLSIGIDGLRSGDIFIVSTSPQVQKS